MNSGVRAGALGRPTNRPNAAFTPRAGTHQDCAPCRAHECHCFGRVTLADWAAQTFEAWAILVPPSLTPCRAILSSLPHAEDPPEDGLLRASTFARRTQRRELLALLVDSAATTSVVLTNPAAALMKVSTGAGLPGHRVTVVVSGQTRRFVGGLLLDAATSGDGTLAGAVRETRRVLTAAGLPPSAQ